MAFTLQIGESAPDFELPGVDGRSYGLGDFQDAKLLVVLFTCNHCPYVIGSEERIGRLVAATAPLGVAWVGINSNETENHPTDDLEHMKRRAADDGIQYPYLRDETQQVALAYGALRTPHFYVFDADRKLCYTGRLDDNPRESAAATTCELAEAIEALLRGEDMPVAVTNPIGCNVKWKDRDAHWMPPDASDLV